MLLYVCLGHGWALAMVLRDNFTLEGVALPLLKLSEGRRGLKIGPLSQVFLASIGMPHQDDGLPLLLSVTVCLFGSWMGSGNGAT